MDRASGDQEDGQFAGIKAARLSGVHWAGITARHAFFAKAEIVGVRWLLAWPGASDFRDAHLFDDIAWYGDYQGCIFADDPGPGLMNKALTRDDRKKPHIASFRGGDFSHSTFGGARLAFVEFFLTNLTEADFSFADLRGVKFAHCRLKAAEFLKARVQRSTFNCCDLAEANFELDTDLQDATFIRCSLNGASFGGAKLQRSTFTDCDLAEANFGGAILKVQI